MRMTAQSNSDHYHKGDVWNAIKGCIRGQTQAVGSRKSSLAKMLREKGRRMHVSQPSEWKEHWQSPCGRKQHDTFKKLKEGQYCQNLETQSGSERTKVTERQPWPRRLQSSWTHTFSPGHGLGNLPDTHRHPWSWWKVQVVHFSFFFCLLFLLGYLLAF